MKGSFLKSVAMIKQIRRKLNYSIGKNARKFVTADTDENNDQEYS